MFVLASSSHIWQGSCSWEALHNPGAWELHELLTDAGMLRGCGQVLGIQAGTGSAEGQWQVLRGLWTVGCLHG